MRHTCDLTLTVDLISTLDEATKIAKHARDLAFHVDIRSDGDHWAVQVSCPAGTWAEAAVPALLRVYAQAAGSTPAGALADEEDRRHR